MKKIIAVLLVGVFFLGCAGASQRVRGGAVLGAAVGSGAGLLKGMKTGKVAGLGLLGAAAGALGGVLLDEVYGPIPVVVYPGGSGVSRPSAGSYPDCSRFSTPGERDACEAGKAEAAKRLQRERERAAKEYGRGKAPRIR